MSCGNSRSSKCNPCGPSEAALNEIANKAAYYARIAQYASDEFNKIYLGAKDVAPTTDNDGLALQDGALYFNTVSNILFVWDGSNWLSIYDDEIYLGGFAVAPTLNNQGLPLISGNLYWNTVSNNLWAHNGTSWIVTNFNEFTNFMLPSATPVDAINLVNGLQYEIAVVGTTNWVAIGASSATVGVRFTKNAVAATGTGTARRTRDLVERFADVVNVKDFGAVGDGVANDTDAIQNAINQAQLLNTSCVVYIPATKNSYRVTSPLTITVAIKLIGDSILTAFSGSSSSGYSPVKTSKLFFDHLGIGINITGLQARGTWVEGLELQRNQPSASSVVPTPWTPAAADFDIVAQDCYDITITDCIISSATKAIKADRLGYGRLNIYDCKINAYDVGMEFDECYDVCRIDNVHIWPFAGNANKMAYAKQNLSGVISKRNDNPKFSNLFVFGAKYGFVFSGSTVGMTERAELNNCGFDDNGEAGIYFSPQSSQNASAQISNTYCYSGEWGIKCESTFNNIQVVNFRSTNARKSAIGIIAGTDNTIQVSNLFCDTWNIENASNPVVYCIPSGNNKLHTQGRFITNFNLYSAPIVDDITNINSIYRVSYNIPVRAETGTITSATAVMFYRKYNGTVKYEIDITITNAGTGSGALVLDPLPFISTKVSMIAARSTLPTNQPVYGRTYDNQFILTCRNIDYTSPIATGNQIYITGEYFTTI